MRSILLVLAVFALSLSGPGRSAPPATDWPEAPATFAGSAELERAAAAFPNSMGLQRRRLAAAVEAKDPAVALDAARRMAEAGAGLSAASRAQVAAVIGAEEMARLNPRFDENMMPLARSDPFSEVPVEHGLIEGIALDDRSDEYFVTGVTGRHLVVFFPNGSRWLDPGEAGSLLGAAFDPTSRRVWIASAVLDVTPKVGATFSGLLAVDPADPARSARVEAPRGVTLGDVALAGDGTVYASDGLKGAVYACRPGCSKLEPVVAPGRLFSAQGMAVSADQKWLYVADRRYGMAAVDRSSGRLVQVSGRPDMMLDGIDGLVRHGRDLVATQTAYAPQRIVRLRLSRDGLRVTRLDVLERANPEWGEVTLAAVAGNRLLYVADAQWERFGEGGAVKGEAPLKPTPIRMLKLK